MAEVYQFTIEASGVAVDAEGRVLNPDGSVAEDAPEEHEQEVKEQES